MENSLQALNTKFDMGEVIQCMAISMENLKDAILIVNKEWSLLFANNSACKFLMRSSKEDMLGNSFWDVLPNSLKTKNAKDLLEKAMEQETPIEFNNYCPTIKTWIHVQAVPTKIGLTITLRETTEQKVALEVTEQVYRTLFDDHPDAVCSVDLKGRVLSINSAFKEIFHLEGKDVLGESYLFLVPEKDRKFVEEIFQFAKKGAPKTAQLDLTKHMGRPFYIMVTAIPIFANSQIVGTYGIIKDITQDQRNMVEVERLYHINQLIMESVEDGILGLDRNLNVVMWNDAAERISGFMKEDLTEDVLRKLVTKLSDKDLHLLKEGFSKEKEIKNDIVLEQTGATFYRKDGSPFICEYTITPMISADEVVGSVLTFRDITAKKKSEELLRQSEKLSAVGQLAAGIAHEIRNPLTSLKGFLHLIETNGGGKQEYFDIMSSEFSRIEQILNELLLLSKPQRQKKKITSLNGMLEHTITLLNTQAVIKKIDVITDFMEQDAYISCLEHKMKQVFINILKNAIEAMEEEGKIVVSLQKNNANAVIKIIDEGCGIAPEALSRIGDPFFTTKEKGTGLGLMVTYQIIEDHGGTIEVDSSEGIGTTFTIELPLVESQ